MTGSAENLRRMFEQADAVDYSEGMNAYGRYNLLMNEIAAEWRHLVERVVAAFCALSPNNDYHGNLRSLVSVLHGLKEGWPHFEIVVSSYKHARDRAIDYLNGASFDTPERGLKILNFYHNILDPTSEEWVTIDGHIAAAWRGTDGTMRDEKLTRKEYKVAAEIIWALASDAGILPCQYQAITWFARKRVLKIRYNGQLDMFAPRDDIWRVMRDVKSIKPYGRKRT